MADYQAQIRLGVQGLSQLNQLNTALERATELFGNLENAQVIAGQIAQGAQRNVGRAARRRAQAGRDLSAANRTVQNVAMRRDPETGRFLSGGPNATARRLATAQRRLAQREVREADRALGESLENRSVIRRAERRYARALNRTADVIAGTQGRAREQAARLEQVMQGIARGSRGNYLTNLFQGRQQELARGGGGRNLPQNLQDQIRANRAAWDLATAGGRENLQVMSRLSTELAGLVRQQNELNRARGGRSAAYEAGRRGRERITDLSRMPGADPDRIRRLRSQTTRVIAAGFANDSAETKLATRRMNASISRYERELRGAARELSIAQRRGGPRSSIRGGANIVGSPAYIDRMARLGGPRESIKGRKEVVGSPAYVEEQQKQLARAIRAGGPRESIKGRKDVVGSPAYYEEQQRQLASAVRRGGPREGIKGRKDLPGSPAYIEEQLKQQRQQLAKAVRMGGPRESIKGRKEIVGSPAYIEEQQKQLARAVRAGGPRESIKGRKNLPGSPAYIEEQQKQQRQQLARAIRAGGPRESIKGRKELVGSPAYYEEQRRQLERAIRAGGPRESIKGRKDLPGSPAYVEEQRKRQERELNRAARMGGPRESVRGRKDLPGSPAYLEEQQRQQERVARMRQMASPIRGTATMVGSPAYYEALAKQQRQGIAGADKGERFVTTVARQEATVAKREDEIARLSKEGVNTARLQRQLDKAKAQVADGSVKAQERFKRSIIELDTDLRRLSQSVKKGSGGGAKGFFRGDLRKAVGEGLIGGAFPLLFGQGLGASVGGFAGGFGGGMIGGSFGFGLSLAGTAIGQVVDNTAKNLTALAASLKSPNDAIAALETSGFRVSDSIKFQVSQLQSVGRAYEAQTLVLQEVQKRLGPGSLTELRDLDAAQKRLQESWGAIGAEIQVRLLPVLQGFVEFLGFAADEINGFANQSRLQRLDPETFEKLRTQAIRETGGSNRPFAGESAREAFNARLNELSRQELSRRFPSERAQVPLAPQDAFDAETTRIEQSRKIADQIQSAYREAFSLQRQAHDLQREGADLNKEIADYSYRKQREIFDLRQQAAEKEIENNRAAAQNRIERGDLNARQAFAAAVGFEQQLLGNVREVMRTRKEGEADIEQSRNKLELALARLNRDVEDYKRSNAREIEDIERRKLSYARSVEDYKMRVADYVRQRSMEAADFIRQAMRLPDAGAGGAGGAAGGSNANRIASALIGRLNLTPAQAAGVVGNFMRESGADINPRINEGGAVGLPARRGGYGIAQWTGSRQTDLIRFAGSPEKAGDLGVQIDFLIKELRTNEGKALGSLRAARSPEEAARVFERDFERAGVKALAERQQNARRFFSSFNPSSTASSAAVGGSSIQQVEQAASRLTGVTNACADAVKIFMQTVGVNANAMDSSAKSAERMGQVMTDWSQLRPGDIVARGAVGDPQHVGVFTGGNNVFHQSASRGLRAGNFADLGYFKQKGYFIRPSGMSAQAAAAVQISSIPRPQFNATPIGATPSAAPINAERMAVLARMTGSEKEAQRILEEQVQLRQKGVELGQIEEILQTSQVPQLEQQYDTLTRQIEARRQNLALSDDAASAADIEAEGAARIAQIEKDRANALSKVQKQLGSDPKLIKQVNTQADLAVGIAKKEEAQRRKNLNLTNELQSADRVRAEVLRLQETLAAGKAESAALEAGRLEATNAELLQASTLYQQASQAQRDKLLALTTETEELRKQNEFRKQINQLAQETAATGAGLRAGFIGAPARAFEEELKRSNGNVGQATDMANRTKLLEDQQLIWNNLEKSIVDVSDAISGALTNGLVDIVGGARTIEDVGRDMLNSMAGSFADIAQQQLSNLMQRQLGSMLGGAGGPLTKMLGAGTEAAGAQALGTASAIAAGQVTMFGMALQTVAAQAGVSGALSGGGGNLFGALGSGLLGAFGSGLSGGFGSGILNASPNLFGDLFSTVPSFDFGGYYANGGVTKPGEGYVVGEKEPEFFFPGVSGRVVPRSDMEKAEALRQDSAEAEPIDVRYTVTEQRGERYVTEEQFRKGMADTTKRAQAMTYAGMRNNKQVRDFVSI